MSDDAESIISKAFLLMRSFRGDPVLGVSELSRRTGIPRTTVFRLANQLFEEGALSRVGTKYRIGATLFELGNLHLPERLRERTQPVLDDLQRITGCDVSLLELVGDDVIVVGAARARRTRSTVGHLGQRLPAHACAGGQVLVAFEHRPLPALLSAVTKRTIVDQTQLQRRLAEIRRVGSAVENAEIEDGRTGVAVPVLNRHGRVLGALMLMGATNTMDLDALRNTAAAFSRALTAAGQQAEIGFFASQRRAEIDEPDITNRRSERVRSSSHG
jgi:DNA-binding IclR family transcriptional regulator